MAGDINSLNLLVMLVFFNTKKDLHTVVVHFGILKLMHHSCHGYFLNIFFQCIIYHIYLV